MLRGIDHAVVVVPELEAAMAAYRGLGFTVVPGGRHPIGSHNALIGFADGAYLELIAFFEPTAIHRWKAALARGGGLVDLCMQTDDLAADAAAFRAAGVRMGEPWPLSRTRPDGYALSWVLATPDEAHAGVAPFLIQDTTPRVERVPRDTRHANGATGIESVTLAVGDVEAARRLWGAVLGQPGRDVRRDDLGVAGARFTAGPHAVEVLGPAGGARGAPGPLTAWLAERGGGPFALTLATAAMPQVLDVTAALGARITLARREGA
jgi:catechol 2,3-dioxygenase-like lactoylglutathione lyase family enzyme